MDRKKPRADPTRFLPLVLREEFFAGIRSGDTNTINRLLDKKPLLSQARTSARETPLLIAAVHAVTSKAVEMIDLLMQRGAVLGSRDLPGRNVLLYACHHGVEWRVVECVLNWDASVGGGILKWSDWDKDARSALILACEGGHTRLALNLLDKINIEEYATENHPFHVLYTAIKFGDEPHALAIAGHPKIQTALGAANLDNYKCRAGIFGLPEEYTIAKCANVAIRLGMAEVLRLMDNLNHLKVSKVTWYSIHKISRANARSRHPAILDIAEQYAKDWRWEQVKLVFLLRERNVKTAGGQSGPHALALLPDQLFRLVVEFLQSKEVPKRETHSAHYEGLVVRHDFTELSDNDFINWGGVLPIR